MALAPWAARASRASRRRQARDSAFQASRRNIPAEASGSGSVAQQSRQDVDNRSTAPPSTSLSDLSFVPVGKYICIEASGLITIREERDVEENMLPNGEGQFVVIEEGDVYWKYFNRQGTDWSKTLVWCRIPRGVFRKHYINSALFELRQGIAVLRESVMVGYYFVDVGPRQPGEDMRMLRSQRRRRDEDAD